MFALFGLLQLGCRLRSLRVWIPRVEPDGASRSLGGHLAGQAIQVQMEHMKKTRNSLSPFRKGMFIKEQVAPFPYFQMAISSDVHGPKKTLSDILRLYPCSLGQNHAFQSQPWVFRRVLLGENRDLWSHMAWVNTRHSAAAEPWGGARLGGVPRSRTRFSRSWRNDPGDFHVFF